MNLSSIRVSVGIAGRKFAIATLFISTTAVVCQAAGKRQEYDNKVVVKPLLQTATTVTGQPIQYPRTHSPEVKMLMVEIPPGVETGWHTHPMPCFGYVLSGKISVEVRDPKRGRSVRTFHAGDALAETINTPHNGKNTGKVPVRILMTMVGVKGAPVAEKMAEPKR